MPIIVESNAAAAEVLVPVLGSGSCVVSELADVGRALAASPGEHVVVLGADVDLTDAVAWADDLRLSRPEVGAVLLRHRVDTAVLSQALRSGLHEVVADGDVAGLRAAVQRTRARRPHQLQHQQQRSQGGHRHPVPAGSAPRTEAPPGRVVTVFSPARGAGSTTIAVNLAAALSPRARAGVCLVDLDPRTNRDAHPPVPLSPTVAEAVASAADDGDLSSLEPLLTQHRGGFSVLVAPVDRTAPSAVPAALVPRLVALLKSHYDVVVVDTSPSLDEQVLPALGETDELLLVTTLDVRTVKGLVIATETLNLLGFPRQRRHLILNGDGDGDGDGAVDGAIDGSGLSPAKLEATLDMSITQAIPRFREVSHGDVGLAEPITVSHPEHPVSQALIRLADAISGVAAGAAAGAGAGAGEVTARKRGLLRRGPRRRASSRGA